MLSVDAADRTLGVGPAPDSSEALGLRATCEERLDPHLHPLALPSPWESRL